MSPFSFVLKRRMEMEVVAGSDSGGFPLHGLVQWRSWLFSAGIAFVFGGASVHGQMVESFSDSARWQLGVPKQWKSSGNGGEPPQEASVGVQSEYPLGTDTGSYLKVAVSSVGTNKRWNVHLRYPSDEETRPYTLSFLYRLDNVPGGRITSDLGKVMFFEWSGDGGPLLAAGDNAIWAIQSTREAASPEWILSNGEGFDGMGNILNGVSTGVLLELGAVYSFTVFVDPRENRYKVKVVNLTGQVNHNRAGEKVAAFTSGWLRFDLARNLGGKSLVFLEHKRRGEGTVSFSIDEVKFEAGIPQEVAQ